jgi:cell division protein FtsI (penicillin-binding protein 3)
MRSRIVVLLAFLACLWSVLIGRAAYLQLIPDARLQGLQKRQFETVVTLNARRGDVLDRNGHELAVSMTTYSVFADPKLIDDIGKIRRILWRSLAMNPKQLDAVLKTKKKRFVWVQRHIDRNVKELIEHDMKEAKLRGIGFVEESKRVYPNEKLLAQTLGFVGENEGGLEGLELKYNNDLQAGKKKVSLKKDARGRPLLIGGQMFEQAPDGADIQLTIDRELQFVLEQELAATVTKHEADSAVGVILDAQTSEILAMGSSPTFDPNRAFDFGFDRKRNRTVTDSFEPGSTMKSFIIAGALQRKVIEPNSIFDCNGGELKIGKRTIHEATAKEKFHNLTATQILAYSSNVGAAKIAFKLGEDRVNDILHDFGFGERTGVDLPGEARGIVQAKPWSDILLANIGFGHGVATTPLQIANAYAAIANGGTLHKPYIVKSIRDSESREVAETKTSVIRQVMSPDAAAKMRLMLANVTTGDGTGVAARVPGFPVAGKTGTAQKVNPNGRGYIKGGYIASFAGFLPANDPKFVIYIAVDHPRKDYYGASVAAPVFARIATFAVRRAGISPVLISQSDLTQPTELAHTEVDPVDESLPQVVPSKAAKFFASLAPKSLSPRILGTSAKLITPKHELSLDDSTPAGQAAGVDLAAVRAPVVDASSSVPNLEGLTLREVLSRVTGTGVEVRVHGEGIVSKTIPAPGAAFASSKELNIYLTH